MRQFCTLDESFENHLYLAGTCVTVKLALQAGPLGELFELTIKVHKEMGRRPVYASIFNQNSSAFILIL
jgi:hypothetical protein